MLIIVNCALTPQVYNSPFTADKLHKTLHVSSSTLAPRRQLVLMAETCSELCLVQLVRNKYISVC